MYNLLKDCKTYEEALKKVWKTYKEVLTKGMEDTKIISRFKEVSQLLWIKRKSKGDKIFPGEWLDE